MEQTWPILGAAINAACMDKLEATTWEHPIEVAVIDFESAVWWNATKGITTASMLMKRGGFVAVTKLAGFD